MKILQVAAHFSPAFGGAAGVPYYLSKELARRGHKVTLYTSDLKLSKEYLTIDAEIHAFKTWLSLAGFQATPGMISRAEEETRHYNVIHMHNYRTFQNIVMHYYAKRYNVPYVLQAHGSLTTFFQKEKLKKIFDAIWGYKILRDASKFIAVTQLEIEHYKSMGIDEDKIVVIPNGIDLSEFDNLPKRGEFKKKYNLGSNQKVILYLGRIHKTKGLDLLVRAFAGLSESLTDARLVIVGSDDGYLSSLRSLIANLKVDTSILFTGPLYGQEKLEAYVDADVYALPSSYEIFGITILEALACGTPIVMTGACGIADVIDGQAGLVVPYDEELLRKALLDILGDDQKRQQFSEKGKLLVREKFNWRNIAEQVEALYEKVLQNSKVRL